MPATSLAQALGLILHGPSKTANLDIVLLDYRDPDTFRALWLNGLESGELEIDGQKIDLNDSTKQFLLIGNDPPDGIFDTKIPALAGINFRSHFTATSWLAAWKVKFDEASPQTQDGKTQDTRPQNADQAGENTQSEESGKSGSVEKDAAAAEPRIAVIDSRPAGSTTGVAQALQSIFSARDATGQPLVPGATVLNAPSLEVICQWLKPVVPETRTLAKNAPHLRELLKSTIWNELTSNREQHHALSNVLGPVILSGRKIDENCFKPVAPNGTNEEQQQAAASDRVSLLLRRLLSACGLVSWEDKDATGNESQSAESGKDLQILLLDDQAKQGWEEWVKESLSDANGGLKTIIDPAALVKVISDALEPNKDAAGDPITGYKNKDVRFCLKLPELGDAANPVLLLDLRLFSGNPNEERKFLKEKLLPLVDHFTDKPDLAWPGFSTNAPLFQRAKNAVEAGTLKPDTDEHHEVLTWLPRVVALADMSLPIILFSSTGRRDLVEPFKPYGNIITSFEKPRLNALAAGEGKTTTMRTSVKGQFQDAVARARNWLTGRSVVLRVENIDMEPLEKAREAFKDKTHFEIFHDESSEVEKRYFRVSSLLAGFDTETTANDYNSQFPLKFYGKNCEAKRAAQTSELTRWESRLWPQIKDKFPATLLSVSVRDAETKLEGNPDSIFDSCGLDNINWDLLSLLWESLLLDVLPSILAGRDPANDLDPESGVTIRIYGATRFRPVQLNASNASDAVDEAKELIRNLQQKWGIDASSGAFIKDSMDQAASSSGTGPLTAVTVRTFTPPFRLLWRSLKSDSFWKLIAEICFGRRDSPHYDLISNSIKKAIGFMLIYDEGKSWNDVRAKLPPEGRHLHYLVDLASGLIDVDTPGIAKMDFEPFKEAATRGVTGFRDRVLLMLNANRLLDSGGCECEAIALFNQLPEDHPEDIAYLALVERLRKCLPMVGGLDYSRIVTYLENPPIWLGKNRVTAPDRIKVVKKPDSRTISASPHSTFHPGVNSSVGGENVASAQSPDRLDRRAFENLCQRWRARRYVSDTEYTNTGADWDRRTSEGFRVRKSKKGSIIVFADLGKVEERTLPMEFGIPAKTYFKADGDLLGRDWAPNRASSARSAPLPVPDTGPGEITAAGFLKNLDAGKQLGSLLDDTLREVEGGTA